MDGEINFFLITKVIAQWKKYGKLEENKEKKYLKSN